MCTSLQVDSPILVDMVFSTQSQRTVNKHIELFVMEFTKTQTGSQEQGHIPFVFGIILTPEVSQVQHEIQVQIDIFTFEFIEYAAIVQTVDIRVHFALPTGCLSAKPPVRIHPFTHGQIHQRLDHFPETVVKVILRQVTLCTHTNTDKNIILKFRRHIFYIRIGRLGGYRTGSRHNQCRE